jgi:hypothetical protein
MADSEPIEKLRAGAEVWNRWRRSNTGPLDLRNADLQDLMLHKGVLRELDLSGSDLRGANLYGSDARESILVDVNFTGGSLVDVDFRGADLRGAKFAGCSMEQVHLDGATIGFTVGGWGEVFLKCIDPNPAPGEIVPTQFRFVGPLPGGGQLSLFLDPVSPQRKAQPKRVRPRWHITASHPDISAALLVRAEDRGTRFKKPFVGEDPQLGAPEFDDAVFVEADPDESLVGFDAESRARVMDLVVLGAAHEDLLGEIRDGAVYAKTPVMDGEEWAFDTLQPFMEIVCGICFDLANTTDMGRDERLLALAREDSSPTVRQRALARYLGTHLRKSGEPSAIPADIDPMDLSAALVRLLEEQKEHREEIIPLLAERGTEAAVAPLLKIADALLGDNDLKNAARVAATHIVGRLGGLRAGGLSLSADDSREGGVSIADDDPDDSTPD